jgi:hypothetical protein
VKASGVGSGCVARRRDERRGKRSIAKVDHLLLVERHEATWNLESLAGSRLEEKSLRLACDAAAIHRELSSEPVERERSGSRLEVGKGLRDQARRNSSAAGVVHSTKTIER